MKSDEPGCLAVQVMLKRRGPTGDTGASGIVSTAFGSGTSTAAANDGEGYAFVSATATFTVTDGQAVMVDPDAALGTTDAGGSNNLPLFIGMASASSPTDITSVGAIENDLSISRTA